MRKLTLVLLAACLSLLVSQAAFAQCEGEQGIPDTVAIECQALDLTPGATFTVHIKIWVDQTIGGASLGFQWSSDAIEYQSAALDPAVAALGFVPQIVATPAERKVLLGTFVFGLNRIPASTSRQGIFDITFKIADDAPISRISIDSLFIPPAGNFLLVNGRAEGGGICPEYAHCGQWDVTLAVEDLNAPVLPTAFALGQNTPNPFNPTTTIDFALPKASNVRVEVFNILGQKVTTLVDEYLSAGFKRVDWDGTDATGRAVASGVYLYKMTAGDFSETKKMMLMK